VSHATNLSLPSDVPSAEASARQERGRGDRTGGSHFLGPEYCRAVSSSPPRFRLRHSRRRVLLFIFLCRVTGVVCSSLLTTRSDAAPAPPPRSSNASPRPLPRMPPPKPPPRVGSTESPIPPPRISASPRNGTWPLRSYPSCGDFAYTVQSARLKRR
jgi:hypothetical protein